MSFISFERKNPLQAMQGVAKSIALPHECSPVRFPSFPALERTALIGFSQPLNVAFPANTVSYQGMVARQAAYPFWLAQDYPSGVGYYLIWRCNYGTFVAGQTLMYDNATILTHGTGSKTATGYSPGLAGIASTPTGFVPTGVDTACGGAPWIYVPAGSKCYPIFNRATFSADPAAKLVYHVWVSPGEYVSAEVDMSAPGANVNLIAAASINTLVNAWVRPHSIEFSSTFTATNTNADIAFVVVTGSSVTVTNSATVWPTVTGGAGTNVFLPLVVASEIVNSQIPWFAARTTAASLLLTNVTQVLNKAGTLLAGRCSPNIINPFSVLPSYITNLHPAEKANLGLEHGFYTYVPPSTDMSNFWDYTLAGFPNVPVYRLDNDSLVNVFFVTDAVASNFAACVDWHMEFRNTSALFQVGLSTLTLESLHQAQLSLVEHGFFFNNINHKQMISTIVGGIKKYSAKYGPAAIGMVNPVAGKVARIAADYVAKGGGAKVPKATNMIKLHDNPSPKKKKEKKKGKK